MKSRLPAFYRRLARFLLIVLFIQLVYPPAAYALTGGPAQPEFSTFENVNTSEMVNPFTGDFTYNLPVITIPGPQGSSYPIGLSYHSGSSPEEESSWVGYGWTLSPGSIARNMRGLPDDDNGTPIKYWNKMPKNWTVTAGVGASLEVFSKETKKSIGGVSADVGIRYNNYNGFGYNTNVGLSTSLFKGVTNVSLGISNSETGRSYSVGVSPYKNLAGNLNLSLNESPDGVTFGASYNPYTFLNFRPNKEGQKQWKMNPTLGNAAGSYSLGGNHGLFSFSEMVRPLAVTPYDGTSVDVKIGLEGDAVVPVGLEGRITGSYSVQKNKPSRLPTAYGYMYAAAANNVGSVTANDNELGVIQDYYVEKETSYNKRDKFLGMGFNNADNFTVYGEGVGGGFRLYHRQLGQFSPTFAESKTIFRNVGVDVHVGNPFGLGGTAEKGEQKLTETDWNKGISLFANPAEDNEAVFFRFNNDQAGLLDYQMTDDRPVQARIGLNSTGPVLHLPAAGNATPVTLSQRAPRSSFVGYNTNDQMIRGGNNQNPSPRSYSRRTDINQQASRSTASNKDRIGELAIYNTSGMQYIYALPVYSRNEKHLQLGVKGLMPENNYLVYGSASLESDNNPVKTGQERINGTSNDPYASAYATTYLLTQITTPDYVDKNFNGPDALDAGGYTLFHYNKLYGKNNNDWYKWRMPYNGLLFQRGTLSDPIDDRGSLSEGEKEIYLVDKIETKTHIAVFRTSERQDGWDAPASEATVKNRKGTRKLQKLDRIDLYYLAEYKDKGDNARPIKSVLFSYDYSLCKGLPNAATPTTGKLTLKKVWFEYYGVQHTNGKISPYVFEYEYPNYDSYPEKYRSELRQGYDQNAFSAADQNPNFSEFQTDAWGNYQANGVQRFLNMQPWVNQTPPANFDPAAWQLKVIKLPSGGEVHVQYEQDDYGYVQDQPAHIMCALDETLTKNRSTNTNKFYLSTQGESPAELQQLRQLIEKHYVNKGNKIYFKFLYRLLGIGGPNSPELNDCNAEYISGYADVTQVSIEGGKVCVHLGKGSTNQELPKEVCSDFVQSQRVGKLISSGGCNGSSAMSDGLGEEIGEGQIVNAAIGVVRNLINIGQIKLGTQLCMQINPNLSYLKIPSLRDKKGGGLRVKRLLTYDRGLNGEQVLYGNEYIYKVSDPVRSSGVATHEPSVIREENVLVGYMPRFNQGFASKVIAGIDKKQTEGPLGETLLPGASVGYSRVIIRNIHSGKTSPGFAIKEYYTANQLIDPNSTSRGAARGPSTYAFRAEQTDIQSLPAYKSDPGMFRNEYINISWMTQGFSFFINDMHGKPKRDATYAGFYSLADDVSKAVLVTEQVYEYFKPGQAVPVMEEKNNRITLAKLGTEIDVTYAQKRVTERMDQNGIVGDMTLFFALFGIPFPIILPTSTNILNGTYVHTTTKVIRQTCMLHKKRSYADGIYHTEENLAFDRHTGQPVWTKSYDEFAHIVATTGTTPPRPPRSDGGTVIATDRTSGGAYAIQTQLAAWQYPGMSGKYLTENKLVRSQVRSIANDLSFTYSLTGPANQTKQYLTVSGPVNKVCQMLDNFVPGDLVALNGNAYYHVGEIDYLAQRIYLHSSSLPGSVSVGGNGTNIQELLIVRSGRTNELTVPAGSTTYHTPDARWETVLANGYLSYLTSEKDANGADNPFPFSIPVRTNTTELTGVQQLASDLNTNYQAASQAKGSFTLSGTYNNINISAYTSKMSVTCQIKPDKAQIRNIKFNYKKVGENTVLSLVSFEAICSGGTIITIKN